MLPMPLGYNFVSMESIWSLIRWMQILNFNKCNIYWKYLIATAMQCRNMLWAKKKNCNKAWNAVAKFPTLSSSRSSSDFYCLIKSFKWKKNSPIIKKILECFKLIVLTGKESIEEYNRRKTFVLFSQIECNMHRYHLHWESNWNIFYECS